MDCFDINKVKSILSSADRQNTADMVNFQLARLYICCTKRARSILHQVVQTGQDNMTHRFGSCKFSTFRVGWVDFMFSPPDLPTLYSETQSGKKAIKIIKNLHYTQERKNQKIFCNISSSLVLIQHPKVSKVSQDVKTYLINCLQSCVSNCARFLSKIRFTLVKCKKVS